MKIERCVYNPLLTPADVKPSRQDFKIDGVFNCGVTEYKDEVILLLSLIHISEPTRH